MTPSALTFKCIQCGSQLTYSPGATALVCGHCGARNEVPEAQQPALVEETEFRAFLAQAEANESLTHQVLTVKCRTCGAESTLRPHVVADACPFCASPLVVENQHTATLIKPRYLLPFKVEQKTATDAFWRWLKGLWFAPNKLKHKAQKTEQLNGVYIPYWTYDAFTVSSYTGQRGDDRTESYTVTINGRRETRTRTVTDWSFASGQVYCDFDDVLVVASPSLPEKQTQALEPWDLAELVDYNEKFLSGFRAETYQVTLEQGFDKAQVIMDERIRAAIRRDIGGDRQRIDSVSTKYEDVTFKHLLLPLWISAYRYSDKVFRFVINARTGEVQGERPYSWVKIALAVLAALALFGGIAWLSQQITANQFP